MKILFTAFKGVHNTSFQLVNQTVANHILLTNSFQGLEKDISFVSGDCSIVYMFGVDKELIDKVRIEKSAKYNAETVHTDFDIHYLETMLGSVGVSYIISDKPTRFLCNAAYYHMLKKNPNTVFIHIPSLKGMSIELMNKLIKIFNYICSN
jgi:hypothetical protein